MIDTPFAAITAEGIAVPVSHPCRIQETFDVIFMDIADPIEDGPGYGDGLSVYLKPPRRP